MVSYAVNAPRCAMVTSAPIIDRRTHARISASLALRYGTTNELITGELLDVGAGGIGIIGEKFYPVGTELELRFRSRAADTDLLTLRAVVRHAVLGKRMGLEFVNVRPSDFARTLATIERLAASQMSKSEQK
jgi:c-di-GMP-binding flagellar brake protein YcgR